MEPEGDPEVYKIHAETDAWKGCEKIEKNCFTTSQNLSGTDDFKET